MLTVKPPKGWLELKGLPKEAKTWIVGLCGGSLLAGMVFGWSVHSSGDFAQNYFSAEQTQKRAVLKEQEKARLKMEYEEAAAKAAKQKAIEDADIAAQKKVGQEHLTPDIKSQIFARSDLNQAVCFPQGYTFQAEVNDDGRITYFENMTFFDSLNYSQRTIYFEKCATQINLPAFWKAKDLGDVPTLAHFDVIKDIYVRCATGFSESETIKYKEGVLSYSFGLSSREEDSLYANGRLDEYALCVSNLLKSPAFQTEPK